MCCSVSRETDEDLPPHSHPFAVSLLDYLTIVPGLVSIVLSSYLFSSSAFIVAQTLRVFRVFRIVRLMRIVGQSTSSSLNRQFFLLGITVLAMVFASAAIFQILDSKPGDFTPFLYSVLYMTITIIGRPPVPTKTDAAKTMEIITIFLGSFIIPAFVAELARLYFEQQGREVFDSDKSVPHVIVCGDVNTSRLRAFLVQFFHKSRDPELLSPMVVLADHKFEGALKTLIEKSSYTGNVKYLRGNARKPGDLKRAGCADASSVIVLCHRTNDVDPVAADADVVAISLAVKNINRRVRVLTQIRRPRAREHLMCLPGWSDSDRAVSVSSLAMTMLGVGCLVPGLPTLLTNLIHVGDKDNARSSNPRRRKFMSVHSGSLGLNVGPQAAGLIVGHSVPWWELPLMYTLDVLESAGAAMLGDNDLSRKLDRAGVVVAELTRPMNLMEECVPSCSGPHYFESAHPLTPPPPGIRVVSPRKCSLSMSPPDSRRSPSQQQRALRTSVLVSSSSARACHARTRCKAARHRPLKTPST